MDYAITLSGQSYTLSTSDAAQIAAITACRTAYNAGKEEADQLADDASYLQFVFTNWVAANPGFSDADLQAAAASAFASYAGQNPPEQILQQPLTGDALKAALLAYANAKHDRVLTGGVVIGGVAVETTERGLIMLQGAYSGVQADPTKTVDWVTDSGPITLSTAQVTGIALAVFSWVQSTYTALGAVMTQIMAGAITSQAEIDAYAWPSNS